MPVLAVMVVALVLSACATAPRAPADAAQVTLVAAERAFAADALGIGVRAAFLRHFVPGGLLFVPAPVAVDEVFAQPPPDPLATLLEWEPVASGVAASGEFGFTSGPARISRRDGSVPVRHSTFFSVWKRQGGEPWRVVIDAGVTAAAPVAHERLLPAPRVHPAAPGALAALDALLADERGAAWTREAFLARLAPDALAQRSSALHAAGAAAIIAAWPEHEESLQPLGGDMAASGDLAYTYGVVKSVKGTGHYLHLWTRDVTGRAWRIAAALRLP